MTKSKEKERWLEAPRSSPERRKEIDEYFEKRPVSVNIRTKRKKEKK
jgi:hypothetical protein